MCSRGRCPQAPSAVVQVRPLTFAPNQQTAVDNNFQRPATRDPALVAADAYGEATGLAEALRSVGVDSFVFDDLLSNRPDSVFPNNWFSTHPDGTLVLYPMAAPSRRLERRADIVTELQRTYRISRILDFSRFEDLGVHLEGTGSIVFDHREGIAFMARSHRSDDDLLRTVCAHLGYEPFVFDAVDRAGVPIYHTNVMMSVGCATALVGFDSLPDRLERRRLRALLRRTGRSVVELTARQLENFAGNALELTGRDGPVLALSARAFRSLSSRQRQTLAERVALLPVPVDTIELAGGSVRCMIAGIHLAPRVAQQARPESSPQRV